MTPVGPSVPTTPAFAELLATLEQTDDAEKRQLALLRYYGLSAQTQAQHFLDDLLVNRDLRPGEDLAARGQVVVDQMLTIFYRENAVRGLDFPEFVDATKQIVTLAFFTRLNEKLLAMQTPHGTA